MGNSIGYQLLLQSHPSVSEKLINGMYPLLKVTSSHRVQCCDINKHLLSHNYALEDTLISFFFVQELHSSSEWLFNDYLDAYNESLKMKATPQCLHPSDLPTVKFLVDLSVHVSSLPVSNYWN